jgi:hypothetical protein
MLYCNSPTPLPPPSCLVFDDTRKYLLRGRHTGLALVSAQLKEQLKQSGSDKAPIWVDLGGGTGKITGLSFITR